MTVLGSSQGAHAINELLSQSVCEVGLDPAAITAVTLLREQHGHALYRLACGRRSFVLKVFANSSDCIEVHAYALLPQLGVPVLPLYGRSATAVLLADLATDAAWRLATEDDTQQADVGAALAVWYRNLHDAGQALLGTGQPAPRWLRREDEVLQASTILQLGEQLQPTSPMWQLAAEHIDALKGAIRSLPATLTYNDFDWTNLALSRHKSPSLRALVFDYHQLGIGMRWSDYRNVRGALGASARAAWEATYGPLDEREALLDAPVAVLHALHVALQRPQLPRWALGLVRQVTNGELAAKLRRAIASL